MRFFRKVVTAWQLLQKKTFLISLCKGLGTDLKLERRAEFLKSTYLATLYRLRPADLMMCFSFFRNSSYVKCANGYALFVSCYLLDERSQRECSCNASVWRRSHVHGYSTKTLPPREQTRPSAMRERVRMDTPDPFFI